MLGQQRGHALERLPRSEVGAGLGEPGVDRVVGEQAARQTRRVHQHVAHVHGPLRLDQRDALVVADHPDLECAPLRDVAVHRIEQLEHAPLVELHECDGGDRLGHGVDAEDGVVGHRDRPLAVHEAERAVVRDVTAAHDRDLAACDLAGVHVGRAEVPGDALQPGLVHAGCLGFDLHRSVLHASIAALTPAASVLLSFCSFCSF